MARSLTLLYVYSLTLLLVLTAQHVSGDNTYCRYPNLHEYPTPHSHKAINVDEFNGNCLRYPSFNATIKQGTLVIEGCTDARYHLANTSPEQWIPYTPTAPVTIPQGQSVQIKCSDGTSTLLVSPPTLDQQPDNTPASSLPSVFVVMVDAVAVESLHRLMPQTLDALKGKLGLEVFEFSKYLYNPHHYFKVISLPLTHSLFNSYIPQYSLTLQIYSTVGLNSNPNKFALFGRHDYYEVMHSEAGRETELSWLWQFAKDSGYTTVIAEDECPRHDSVWDMMKIPTASNNIDPATGPDHVLLSQMCVEDPHPNKYCIEGRWGYDYVSDYVSDLLASQKEKSKKPIFMWSNFIDAHEPVQWAAAVMDNSLVNYLTTISQSSFMDNGIIVFLSDHGIHFGDYAYSSVLGSAENKHPFMYVMAKKGVLNSEILQYNQDKLISPFDMYRTLSSVIAYKGPQDPRDVDIFNEKVPIDRTCDMAGVLPHFCLCSYGPECQLHVPAYLWHTCVSQYAHPRLFDWTYYNKEQLQPRFGRDFSECEATQHWCAHGLSLGWNGTANYNLRSYVAYTPELATQEFCWDWPNDCNWGNVARHYFTFGYAQPLPKPI